MVLLKYKKNGGDRDPIQVSDEAYQKMKENGEIVNFYVVENNAGVQINIKKVEYVDAENISKIKNESYKNLMSGYRKEKDPERKLEILLKAQSFANTPATKEYIEKEIKKLQK